jgi:hypothetical protein
VPEALTVNGVPEKELRIALTCQPPAKTRAARLLLAQRLPAPKGSSVTVKNSRLWGRSKPVRARLRAMTSGALKNSPLSLLSAGDRALEKV